MGGGGSEVFAASSCLFEICLGFLDQLLNSMFWGVWGFFFGFGSVLGLGGII